MMMDQMVQEDKFTLWKTLYFVLYLNIPSSELIGLDKEVIALEVI